MRTERVLHFPAPLLRESIQRRLAVGNTLQSENPHSPGPTQVAGLLASMGGIVDDEAQAAKDTLEAAIKAYHRTVDPDMFIDSWVLISHKMSVELEAEGSSMVGHLVPTGQAWPLTVGLLRIASNNEEFGKND